MREHVAGLDQQHVGERHRKRPVDYEHPGVARMRVLGDDRGADHRAVVRNDARVVGDEQRASARGHVSHPIDLDPPVLAIKPKRDVLDALREFGVKAEAIASEFQLGAGTHNPESPHSAQLS